MLKILSSCSLIHCILVDLEVKYWEPPFINDDEACYKYGENHRYSPAGTGLQPAAAVIYVGQSGGDRDCDLF